MGKHSDRNDRQIVTLREYVEEKFAAQEKATEFFQRMLDDRLEGMNEFRADLRRQAADLITRREVMVFIDRLIEDIRSLRESRANAEGKASQLSVYITFLFALLGLIVATASLIINKL